MAENIGIGFVIGAALAPSVGGAFASLEQKIRGTSSRLSQLRQQDRRLADLANLREKAVDLQSRYAATGGTDKILGAALQSVTEQYRKARVAAKNYGIEVTDYAKAHSLAAAEIKRTEAAMSRYKGMQAERERRTELGAQLRESLVPLAAVVVPLKLSMDFESTMADVKKVTNFDAAGFDKFSGDILAMSTRLPIAADGLGQIAAAAGAAGIAEADLLAFTEDAAKMGVAFGVSAAEAGAAMTGLRNNFKLSQDEVRLLGDAMNALSNSMDAKAAQIVDFANRAGGTAKIYGMTGQEVSALGAAFLDAKVSAEEASTATNSMLTRLGTADKLPKDAQEAFASLGISGKGLAKAFQEDAQGALLAFLHTVSKSKDPMRALSAIFGADHAPKIAKLVNNLGRYEQGLSTVSDAESYAGSTNEEYATRAETTANKVQLLKNSFARLGITVGNTLLPPLNWVLERTIPYINAFADWAAQNEGVTATVMGLVGGFVAMKVGGLAAGYGLSLIRSGIFGLQDKFDGLSSAGRLAMRGISGGAKFAGNAFSITWGQALAPVGRGVSSVRQSFARLRGTTMSAVGSMRSFSMASLMAGAKASASGVMAGASRVGWNALKFGVRGVGLAFKTVLGPVSLLMTALSFGVEYVISNWDTIGPYFQNLWDGVKMIFDTALKWMQPVFDTVGKAFSELGQAWDWLFGDDEKKVSVETAREKAEKEGRKLAVEPASTGMPSAAGTQSVTGQTAVQPATEAAVTPTRQTAVQPTPSQPAENDFAAALARKTGPPPEDDSMLGGGAFDAGSGVTVNLDVTINAAPDAQFAQGVVNAIRARAGDIQQFFSGIVNDQARVSYGG